MTPINELLPANISGHSGNTRVSNDQLGQEQFLELMVAQLANQDPTNPTDSSEFFSQISQFSMVEGVNSMSEGFNEFTNVFAGSQALNAVNLVGRDVMTNSNVAYLGDSGDGQNSISATLDLPGSASSAVVYVQDEYGNVVQEISMGPVPGGQQQFEWDGTDALGEHVESGNYWLNAFADIRGQTQGIKVFAHSRVDSVVIDPASSEYQLTLNGGTSLESNQIRRIFQ